MIKRFKCQAYNVEQDERRAHSVERIGHDKLSAKRYPLNAKTLICVFAFCIYGFMFTCFAEEITILYTGSTHAMLYPCSCPKEIDGGISRRASLIKQIKKKYPQSLLLDSGGFFAGGLLDEWTQNTQFDSERSLINLRAMELMKYDALNIGSDEFNLGRSFFQDNAAKTKLVFLSSNISTDEFPFVKPYIIKQILNIKVGIVGITDPYARQKLEGSKIIEPIIALKKSVEELKKIPVNIIVLLSYLPQKDTLDLISAVKGVDIVILQDSFSKEEGISSFEKIANTLFLRSSWQGRRLGRATITLKDNKLVKYEIETLRLSDKIQDDPEVLSLLPRCFQDTNCKKDGLAGTCHNPGKLDSRCSFEESGKVNLLIITPKNCRVCDTQTPIKALKRDFPNLIVSYEYYPGEKAQDLIKKFSISSLPAYFLGKEVDKEKKFEDLKRNLEVKGDFYMLKPEFSGISQFISRLKINKKLDLFISLFDEDAAGLLDTAREFDPQIHFLAVENENGFDAQRGAFETEECLRAVCVQKYYPQRFWNYISCRAQNSKSSWWDDCIGAGMDLSEVKACARGSEGKNLLRKNIELNRELRVMFGPAYLVDNQEIFSTKAVPSKEELRKIIKKQ